MLTKGFFKPNLSIKEIGKLQFWAGIVFGIFSAFVFSIYFNQSREMFRSLTFFMRPMILSPKEFMIYDIFFASLSVSLAFGFTVIIWMTGRKKIKKQYYRMFAVGNAWLMIFVILFILLRMASVLNFGVQIGAGFEHPLDYLKDFGLILVLLPIFIFFYNWNYLRLMFLSKYWVSISVLVYILLTFIIFKTTSIDKNILNNIYYSKNRDENKYLDDDLIAYKRLYGITIDDSTKAILKSLYSDKTFNLVKKLKKAFDTDGLVSLDTLFLELTVIRNLKFQGEIQKSYLNIDKSMNWPFAKPEEIYNQIKRYEEKQWVESKLLIGILNEMTNIFRAHDIDWEKLYRKIAPYIESQLKEVISKLRFDKDNKYYSHKLRRIDVGH